MADRIDHAAQAVAQGALAEGASETLDAIAHLLSAQAHATMALVEQQRIANLIALAQLRVGATDLPVFRHLAIESASEFEVRPTAAIREGLGL